MADKSNVVIPVGAAFKAAPPGTTGPADVTTAWNAAFLDLGGVDQDGATVSRSASWEQKKVWQSKSTFMYILTGVELTVKQNVVEWTRDNISLWGGGDTWSLVEGQTDQYMYEFASSPALDERVFGWEWKHVVDADTNYTFRLVVPSGVATDVDDIKMVNDDWSPFGLTVSAMSSDITPLAYLITDFPGVAPA